MVAHYSTGTVHYAHTAAGLTRCGKSLKRTYAITHPGTRHICKACFTTQEARVLAGGPEPEAVAQPYSRGATPTPEETPVNQSTAHIEPLLIDLNPEQIAHWGETLYETYLKPDRAAYRKAINTLAESITPASLRALQQAVADLGAAEVAQP